MSPGEVCKTVRLPQGFKLSPFAAEPEVQNPISITTDDRGRLWVAENYTWAGADAGDFDTKHKDRLVILEDTNGDGRHDKRTVFYDQAERLTSVQVGMGGAWLLCPPQLLFLPDRNRDDVPDGKPEVVLDGFDIEKATHTVANGLKWGPDGWLYGRQGILGTSKIGVPDAAEEERQEMNTGIWRYHPTRRICEVVMHGMTNPWGFDYDQFGEIFVTNTVIGHLWHVVPGARTERMFGQDFNPHAYQLIDQVADHVHWNTEEVWDDVRKGVTQSTSAVGGGHAHTGLLIYQGDNWPAEYRDRLFTLNIHGRRINSDVFEREPVGYVAHHSADMCFIADPWFRGMDLISGADGGVFIADWSDTGECHEWGGVHRTSGRIYKLTYGDPVHKKTLDLNTLSDAELVELQQSPNDWYSRRARLILQNRAATNGLDKAVVRKTLLRMFEENSDPVVQVRALWALHLTDCIDSEWLLERLRHPNEHVRVWAVRFLTDELRANTVEEWQAIAKQLKTIAANEQSGLVLLYLTSALPVMPIEARMPIAEQIALRTDSKLNTDRTLSIMLWLAIEPAIAQHPGEGLQLLAKSTFPLIRENIARRLALNIDGDQTTVERLLDTAATNQPLAADIVRGVAAALEGRNSAPMPTNWKTAFSTLRKVDNPEISDGLDSIGVVFSDPDVMASLTQKLRQADVAADKKLRALQLLLASRARDLSPTLIALIDNPELSVEAIRGLARYDDRTIPIILLEKFGQFSSEQQVAAINTLASRREFARALVQALEEKHIPPSLITAFQVRQIMSLGDAEISDRLRAVWGDARQTPEDKRKLIHDLRVILTPKIAGGNLENGKTLYTKTCASCHVLFGQGAAIGPDLTGSDRKSLEYLLENMIDPSAIVGSGFRVSVFYLDDGRIVSGIVTAENENTVTVNTPEGKQVIDRKNIEEVEVSEKSLMPDGLLQTLNDAEVCDLLAYLMSN